MENTDLNQPLPLDVKKLITLGFSSLLLCLSLLMSILTPFPIALSAVLFGRVKGYGVGAIIWIVTLILAAKVFGDPTVFVVYTLSLPISLAISEILLRGIKPLKGMIIAGGTFLLLLTIGIVYTTQVKEISIKNAILTQIENSKELFDAQKKALEESGANSKEAFEALAMLDQPGLIADQVIQEGPSYIFMAIFLVLWVNLFLLFKSNRIIRKITNEKLNEQELLNIKVPEHFIWIVILSLIATVWGESLGSVYPIVGLNVLKCMGVFYFFQGFGIYLGFLDSIKLTGFFRTALVVLTVFTAAQVIAFIGLFDMFVNFRRFFKKDKNEGEL